jgi:hypothetical protein
LTILSGLAVVNGVRAGELRGFRALDGRDAVKSWRFPARLRAGVNEVVLTNALDGAPSHLRIRSVAVEAPAL